LFISHKYRFIFIRTEKTAGTSLSKAFHIMHQDDPKPTGSKKYGSYEGVKRRPAWSKFSPIHYGALERNLPVLFGLHSHATAKDVRDVVGRRIFDTYYKFAVDRNPWERQLSLYYQRSAKNKKTDLNFDRDMRSAFYRATEYCHLHNWRMYAIGDELVADRVLRYETLSADLDELCRHLGIEQKLDMPRLRADHRPDRQHYSAHYSPATRDLVGRWYAREIEALGYKFEAPVGAAPA
jgi:hypothetical protein